MKTTLLDPPARLLTDWGLRPKAPGPIRDLRGLPSVLARAGSLEMRLATRKKEIRKLQRLRYDVFYKEGEAIPNAYNAAMGRDRCPFDRVCDHLLVVDTAGLSRLGNPKERVVGTYRLLRGDQALAHFGFYSETEFDLGPLLDRHPTLRFLELGRTCVHPDFRSRRVIDMLWRGVGLYAAHHGIDVLIGCSSLAGTQPELLAEPLSYAFHHAASPSPWQVRAVTPRAVRMDWLDKGDLDPRRAMASLPPLMKAYVRAGGTFASQAALDYQFGTTDLFTVLPLRSANARYIAQFGPALAGADRAA